MHYNRHLKATLYILASLLIPVLIPSCSTQQAGGPLPLDDIQQEGEQPPASTVIEEQGFRLELHAPSTATDPGTQFSMQVHELDEGRVRLDVIADGARDLKMLYLTLGFDPEEFRLDDDGMTALLAPPMSSSACLCIMSPGKSMPVRC